MPADSPAAESPAAAPSAPAGTPEPPAVTPAQVAAALAHVCDPCSLAAGTPLSLVDMGLLVSSFVEDGVLDVRLCVTGPGCTYVGLLADAAHRAVRELPGVRAARVSLDPHVMWDPSRMTPAGTAALAARRRRTVVELGLRPRMWAEQV